MKKWNLRSKQSDDIIEQILLNRGIEETKLKDFLDPDFETGLHDPYLLKGMREAVDRIKLAIERHEKIGIFGDYDADGVPASAMLAEFLEKKLKLETMVYIPARKDGYGLNQDGLKKMKSQGVSLMFAIDLGIREVENVEFAKGLGIETIILDHHEPGENLPQALALIDPKVPNQNYPFRELSAGGVTFKFIQALSLEFNNISENDLKWLLDLVGITTICDVVPLVDENRIFAKFGLLVLKKTKRIGLIKLLLEADIIPEKIDTYTVGFQIGPRLNAPGRLKDARASYDLLRSEDPLEAEKLAKDLNKINLQRQDELNKILLEARKRIVDDKLNEKKLICLWDKSWSSGLIGLVAGRITEEFSRPCFILEYGQLSSRGSGRSVANFNLVDALEKVSGTLEKYGGHAKAAGITVRNDQLQNFYNEILVIAEKELKTEDLVPIIEIDAELKVSDITLALFDRLKKLEPHGLSNPRPVFSLKKVKVESARVIGKNENHLKLNIAGLNAVAFNWGEMITKIESSHEIDVAFTLDENNWGNKREVQLKIVDFRFE